MKKRRKKPSKKNYWRKHVIKYGLYLVLASVLLPFILVGAIKTGIVGQLPSTEQLKNIRNHEASEIYSSDNRILGRLFLQNRTNLNYNQISEHTIKALVSTEDKRFFEHHGIDWQSFIRVLFRTILLQDDSGGGGSTISQQLAKNIYHRQQFAYFSMVINKIREMLIAMDLEKLYSKEDILTMYLNTVPFGENIYGIEAASLRFFQKNAINLNIQEAATLVGMLKATTYYNPRKHPEQSLSRRNTVLTLMMQNGNISEAELESLTKKPLGLKYKKSDQNTGPATYFREQLRIALSNILTSVSDSLNTNYNVYTDGLKIYTTIDSKLQNYAETAVNKHMKALQTDFDTHWSGKKKPWESEEIIEREINKSSYYKDLSKEELKDLIRTKSEMDVFSWNGNKTVNFTLKDSIKYYLKFLNVGFLALDPATGEIKAWVGGIDHEHFKYDHVNKHTKRQVGSVFKPIVFASALEHGISPCKYIKASRESFNEENEKWTPGNADDNYDGKYSFEGALTESVNTVSVKILEKAGIENTIELAGKMGIDSDIPNVPSIALGTPDISLFEIVSAYGVFVNNGNLVPAHFITRIEDNKGNTIWRCPKRESTAVLSKETSMMMVEMLKNVVDEGTARRLRSTYMLDNDIAGKTGTTQSNADGWFIGMSPHLVAGVWVGGEYPSVHFRSTALGQGANMALPVFALFMQQINKDPKFQRLSKARFPEPPAKIKHELDCDPFKDDLNFFQRLFGKKKDEDEKKEKKGFLKGLKDLFKKKN